jgi:hypothetical protein
LKLSSQDKDREVGEQRIDFGDKMINLVLDKLTIKKLGL